MGIERLARHPGGNGDRITTVGDLKLLSDRRRRGQFSATIRTAAMNAGRATGGACTRMWRDEQGAKPDGPVADGDRGILLLKAARLGLTTPGGTDPSGADGADPDGCVHRGGRAACRAPVALGLAPDSQPRCRCPARRSHGLRLSRYGRAGSGHLERLAALGVGCGGPGRGPAGRWRHRGPGLAASGFAAAVRCRLDRRSRGRVRQTVRTSSAVETRLTASCPRPKLGFTPA